MDWENILKISEEEAQDFRRFGQPEWDEGIEEIKVRKNKEAVDRFFANQGSQFKETYNNLDADNKKMADLLLSTAEIMREDNPRSSLQVITTVKGLLRTIAKERIDNEQ